MAKAPTKKQKARWDKIRELGCIVNTPLGVCGAPAAIHHAFTGGGGRRDHDKVLPLCYEHHQGSQGIHTISRPVWQLAYDTEESLLTKMEEML